MAKKKQFAVIGMGNFGYYLATRLYEKGHEVLAIDKEAQKIQEIKDKVSHAIIADTADPKVLQSLDISQSDTVIVCIGTDLAASILTTLNLRELGVKKIMAKAKSEAHGRILYRVGAHEVFFPEKDLAYSLAEKLHNPNMLEYLPVIGGYSIVEFAPPKEFVGKSLKELDLINKYGVQVVAVKETVPDKLHLIPTGKFTIKDSDVLILLGPDESLEKLREAES